MVNMNAFYLCVTLLSIAHGMPIAENAESVKAFGVASDTKLLQFAVAIPNLKQTHFQTIDSKGRTSFGYAFPGQVHMESRSDDGQVNGAYFYKDTDGKDIRVHYRADEEGFKVIGNNLPVFSPGPVPQPVEDTPEVIAAKREHQRAWEIINNFQKALGNEEHGDDGDYDSEVIIADPLPSLVKIAGTKPIDLQETIDNAKEAVIVERLDDPSTFAGHVDIDSEPIKLLAMLYSRYMLNRDPNLPQEIHRPQGFHPENLVEPEKTYDMFSRDQGNEAIVINNPEYLDLKAYVAALARGNLAENAMKTDETSISVEAPAIEYPTPEEPAVFTIPAEIYNRYYGLPLETPTRKIHTGQLLPESLKIYALGLPPIDGIRDTQVAPYQKHSDVSRQRFYSNPYDFLITY